MAATVATPVNRSWAKMVQGDSNSLEETHKSVMPARRGSLLRFCRGEVLTMLAHYGWLMLYDDVDHPATEKHGGDVYIHRDDVEDGESLSSGDIVTFYLYVDDQGLGAEMCHVEQKASSRTDLAPTSSHQGFSVNASAKEFVPAVPEPIVVDNVADVFLRLSYAFSDFSDDDGEDEDEAETKSAPSSDGSTYGGATSDSEEESFSEDAGDSDTESMSTEIKVVPLQWRPPPGLSLPTMGISAPPGLLPPGLEAAGTF